MSIQTLHNILMVLIFITLIKNEAYPLYLSYNMPTPAYKYQIKDKNTLDDLQHCISSPLKLDLSQHQVLATFLSQGALAKDRIYLSQDKERLIDLHLDLRYPTALILTSRSANIWKLHTTRPDLIKAILFISDKKQELMLSSNHNIPLIDATNKDCKISTENFTITNLNRASHFYFNKSIDGFFIPHLNNRINFNDLRIAQPQQLLSDRLTNISLQPSSVTSIKNYPKEITTLQEALSLGLIREMTEEDIKQFQLAQLKRITLNTQKPTVILRNQQQKKHELITESKHFLILKPFIFPEEIHRMRPINFYLAKGVVAPIGDLGLSKLYDINDGQCYGNNCPSGRDSYNTYLP